MTELPIACTLSPAEIEEHRDGLLPGLLVRAVKRFAIPNGYRWQFAASEDLLAEIASIVQVERGCCRFLRFRIAAEPDMGPVSLEVTGPLGTREFLNQLMGSTPV